MKILHRYIAKTVISTTLLVCLLLGGLLAFITFLSELKSIGTLNYGIWQAFIYVTLTLPLTLYPFFPIAALLGCLIGLGQLANNSELIVLRAAGVSKKQVTWSVIRATLIMLFFAIFIGEAAAPALNNYADRYKTINKLGWDPLDIIKEGLWLRSGDDFIHIDKALPSGELQGITRYQFSGQQLAAIDFAKSGYYQDKNWMFQNITKTSFIKDSVTTNSYPLQQWDVSIDSKLVGERDIVSDQSSLLTIHQYISYLQRSGLSARSYQFDFWTRVLQPLATIIMITLAIPFIFGPLRTVTMGVRILIGVTIGFGFYTLNTFLGPFSLVYEVPPFLAAVLPLLLVAIISLKLLWRE